MTFSDLIAALVKDFRIDECRIGTFVSRIQQLQKAGALPNPGRGKRIDYSQSDFERITVVLHLIDLGISPERAVARALGDTNGALSYLRREPSPAMAEIVFPSDS